MEGLASGFTTEVFEDLRFAQKSRAFFKAAGLTLQLWEAYGLDRSLRGLLRHELSRYADPAKPDRPPDVHHDLLEKLRLIRDQAGPVIKKLRQFLPRPAGTVPEYESHEMALAFLLSSAAARDQVDRWTSDASRHREEAATEMHQIVELVEKALADAEGLRRRPSAEPTPPAEAPATIERSAPPPVETAAPSISPTASPETPALPPMMVAALPLEAAPPAAVPIPRSEPAAPPPTPAPAAATEPPPPQPPPPPPQAPEGLAAVAGDGKVSLTWKAQPETSFIVKRSTIPGGPYETRASEFTERAYTDFTVINGTRYFFVVVAVNAGGEGPASGEVEAAPLAPPPPAARVSAVPGNGKVTLSWAPVPEVTSYTVRRGTSREGPFSDIASAITGPGFVDTGVVNGTLYVYCVRAANPGGGVSESSPVQAKPLAPPPAPEGLVATLEKGGISLRWGAARGASGYRVERATAPGGPFTSLGANLIETMTLDSSVTKGTTYHYRVVAFNATGGDGPASAEVSRLVPTPPPPPGGLVAAPGNGRVTLSWSLIEGVARYAVKRSTSRGGPYAAVATPTLPNYVDRAVTNGKAYEYVVTATSEGGESAESAPALAMPVAPPEAPKGLSATPANRLVLLTWSALPGATSYAVRRSAERGGPFTTIAKDLAETTYKDTRAANGSLYDYVVIAFNAGGEGPPSAIVRAMPVEPPPAPSELQCSASRGTVVLLWSGSKGATGYTIKRSTTLGGPYEPLGKTTDTRFTDSSVQNGTTYAYVVAAINAGGESAETAEIRATPVEPPPAPGNLVAKPGDRHVALSWAAAPGATEYSVRRSTRSEGPFTTIATPSETRHLDKGAENKVTYHYLVIAVNTAGKSPASPRASATPMPAP